MLKQLTAASASAARGAATARLEEAVAAAQKLRAEVQRAGPRSAWNGRAAEAEAEEEEEEEEGEIGGEIVGAPLPLRRLLFSTDFATAPQHGEVPCLGPCLAAAQPGRTSLQPGRSLCA